MRCLFTLLITLASLTPLPADELRWKAGTARQVITPDVPLWMAGYGNRDKPCDTKQHDLWVKALAIEDANGHAAIILTSDLCGIPRSLGEAVTKEVSRKTGLKRDQIALTCSHTHCGPVVFDNLYSMYPLTPEQPERIKAYTAKLRDRMIDACVKAYESRQPATLSTGAGTARFAVNRREPTAKGIINGSNPTGPVDHDVPTLCVKDKDGKVKAIVFGYACHNTTLGIYEWCGDYAGFAQIELEKKYPDATAMFWIGTGGDANPLPRKELELCIKYGKELAGAVDDVLKKPMQPLTGALTTKYREIALDLEPVPDKTKWTADALSKTVAVRNRAQIMLKQLEDNGAIPASYPHYPVQVWKVGDELTWVILGGEVVIDYNLRLKKELAGRKNLWITGYANDVMSYIPSARNLKEGGYEADSSQIYYSMPGKWLPTIEDAIIRTAVELAK